jgi:hypothetical protein
MLELLATVGVAATMLLVLSMAAEFMVRVVTRRRN